MDYLGSIRVVQERFLVCLNHQVVCASNWFVLLELGWSANLCDDASVLKVDKYSCCKYFCLNLSAFLEFLHMCT